MSFYSLPDITGQNSDYLQVNIPFFIYENGMVLAFENSPVFENSIKIVLADKSGTVLVKGVDYVVNPSDVDQTAMSRAFLENSEFDKRLVKSITIASTKALKKQVAVSFQEFYLTQPGRTFDDGRPFEVTPDLIKNMAAGLADVRQQVAKVPTPAASAAIAPKLLKFDINAEFAANVIVKERVAVNTIAGARVIRLSQGAFFADSLIIEYNGVKINPKTGYLPTVISPLTKNSTNKSGIYQYILLNGDVTGFVDVTYHAVGGEVQIDDISTVYDLMRSIQDFLKGNIFVTSDSISQSVAFRAQNARLNDLENKVRSLLNGSPTYGDTTSNMSVIRPIASVDAKFHWWTIATLYKVQGSNDIVLADQFRGRVHLPGAKISLAFTADVNLAQDRQTISFETENLVFDPTYTLFGDISVAAPVYPMVRLVWNKTAQAYSGACLQIGLPLTALSDQMIVEDLSTTESCWLLDKTGQFISGGTTVSPTSPRDDGFVLPDGSSIWSAAAATSFSRICVPTFKSGYLVYAGANVALYQIESSTPNKSLFPVTLPSYFPLANVSAIIVTMASSDGNTTYDVELATHRLRSDTKAGRQSFVTTTGELIVMNAALNYKTDRSIELALNVSAVTAHSSPLTDVVRYVRVKV